MDIEYLIENYSKLVYKICINMLSDSVEAEDVVQEVYISIYKHIDRYKNLTQEEFKNLICKIALNKCKDILKSNISKLNKITDFDITKLENYRDDNDINSKIVENERKNYISKIINELKEPYKKVIYYYYIKGYNLDEISIKLKIPKSTLKVQIYRAKKILKEKIIESGGDNFL